MDRCKYKVRLRKTVVTDNIKDIKIFKRKFRDEFTTVNVNGTLIDPTKPGTAVFDLNRSLTGMGHERYYSAGDAVGHRPCDVLARRLFEREGVRVVHIYSNVVTVELAPDRPASAWRSG